MKRFLLILFCTAGIAAALPAQDSRLAQQYFQNGEFEKAAVLFEQLFETNQQNDYFFDRYVDCLIALERYDDCEKAIKKQLKRDPKNLTLYVTLGKLLEQQYREADAEQQYRLALSQLPREHFGVIRLANAFTALTKYDLAIETYEKGSELLKDKVVFSFYLAELYRRKGDTPKMVDSYLNSLASTPERLPTLQTTFQRFFTNDDYTELQKQLYARLQQDDNAVLYTEMLAWALIQQQDYKGALRQLRALDKRLRENGGRVFQLAQIAGGAKDYDTAIAAYEYIVDEKGRNSSFYLESKREALRSRRNKLTEGFAYTREELVVLQQLYENFLTEFGRSRITASIIAEQAELEALYLNDLNKSITLLNEVVEFPNLDPVVSANAKLALGDYYLMQGEIWDATLLYSQVDKAFKEDALGNEARYRNARLAYYDGDFQWAQAQFDILKAATSKFVSNDAIDLSVFIMDNLGLDTTAEALTLFSQADMLVFQNRFQEAFEKLDALLRDFPAHSLEDDVLYLKSKIYHKRREYTQQAAALQRIIEGYPEEIRADNALFELGELYQTHLNDVEKAKELYEKLFLDYSGSTFAVEARKRFRLLRGDKLQ
ncbi:MAG: tetratricopeptide repeat protein [Saprospiraceae bacterium]|nr:tetratricopeptide repeat protein [Saprospiraceae bacterium]